MEQEMSEGEYQALTDPRNFELDRAEFWVTKDKRIYPIRQMQSSHLVNVIRFLRRNVHFCRLKEISRMGKYIIEAPEMAADAAAAEAIALMDMTDDEYLHHRFECFATMIEVARQRGLPL